MNRRETPGEAARRGATTGSNNARCRLVSDRRRREGEGRPCASIYRVEPMSSSAFSVAPTTRPSPRGVTRGLVVTRISSSTTGRSFLTACTSSLIRPLAVTSQPAALHRTGGTWRATPAPPHLVDGGPGEVRRRGGHQHPPLHGEYPRFLLPGSLKSSYSRLFPRTPRSPRIADRRFPIFATATTGY